MDGQLNSPNMPASPEQGPGLKQEAMPEAPVASAPERAPVPGNAPAAADAGATSAPKLTAAQVAAAIAATPAPGVQPTSQTPPMAGDVDVIEPEWVEKAEEVVRAHHDDPYAEEEAIEDLQEDYLRKRYGIEVADPHPYAGGDTKPKGA